MLRAAARLRIQKRILVVEIVKAALRNYFENRQSLITEDTYRQFAAGYEFFYQAIRDRTSPLRPAPNRARFRSSR